MSLDKSLEYTFRIGSDNQYRVHWNGSAWHYEVLAGGVLFDERNFQTEKELTEALSDHGMTLTDFQVDDSKIGEAYSAKIKAKLRALQEAGIAPCPKHGLISKNPDGTCEACLHSDYPDDFKGTEG